MYIDAVRAIMKDKPIRPEQSDGPDTLLVWMPFAVNTPQDTDAALSRSTSLGDVLTVGFVTNPR